MHLITLGMFKYLFKDGQEKIYILFINRMMI